MTKKATDAQIFVVIFFVVNHAYTPVARILIARVVITVAVAVAAAAASAGQCRLSRLHHRRRCRERRRGIRAHGGRECRKECNGGDGVTDSSQPGNQKQRGEISGGWRRAVSVITYREKAREGERKREKARERRDSGSARGDFVCSEMGERGVRGNSCELQKQSRVHEQRERGQSTFAQKWADIECGGGSA